MLRVRVSFKVRGLELGFGVGVRVEALQGKTKMARASRFCYKCKTTKEVCSRLVLPCFVLSCLVLPCHVLSCLVLSCLALSCLVLS